MISIYSCKMFRSSNRQKEIISAIQNPLNTELVQQLKEYIDIPDEYKESNFQNSVRKVNRKAVNDEDRADKGSQHSQITHTSSSPLEFHVNPAEDSEALDTDIPEASEEEVVEKISDESSTTEEDITESIKVTKSAIQSSTCIPEQLKGTLNVDESTCGVNRVAVKDKETWVYYNDSVNLNNVMTNVLDKLNAANFSTLSFSRLARSDNAIVFDNLDTPDPVEVIDNGNAKEA